MATRRPTKVISTTYDAGTGAATGPNSGFGDFTATDVLPTDVIPQLAPAKITQDASNRFSSDAEKITWNGKAAPADITTAINNLINSAPAGFDTLGEIATEITNAKARANHTGTQTAATISDFAAAALLAAPAQTSIVGIAGTKAQFNTAASDGDFLFVGDVTSNATHTGEVTGSTALALDKTAITGKTAVAAAVGDFVLISDVSDTDNLKKVTVQSIVDLASGGGASSPLTLTANNAAETTLKLKGAASQTANLLETQNSGGTVTAFFDAAGNLSAKRILGLSGDTSILRPSGGGEFWFADGNAEYNVAKITSKTFHIIMPAYRQTTVAEITANQNDYNVSMESGAYQRLSSDAARNITGVFLLLSGNAPSGRWLFFNNVGSFDIVLKHQDAASTAGNRFLNSTGADITLAPNQAADIYYDSTTERWRVFKR